MATTYDYAKLNEEYGSNAERLAFVDFKLRFTGIIQRTDLAEAFNLAEASSSRLLSLYHELKPNNMRYDRSKKVNVICEESYEPIIAMDAEIALGMLSHGFNKNRLIGKPILNYARVGKVPEQLNIDQVSTLTRAMFNQQAINCQYISANSSNHSNRELVPLTLISDGKNWLFRAYDRSSDDYSFKNFNFARACNINLAVTSDKDAQPYELLAHDIKWNTLQPLLLELHPNLNDDLKASVRRDYGMADDQNEILLTERGALIWLLCNQWLIDKRDEESSKSKSRYYNFQLKNRHMLLDYL
ncbi:transcriptional regulator [Pseudoalteromonas rubra]|uniref:Transcriptional regulator n=1 Tax=Pseudoalteromonas rubra TaxID=43658 RepID=A0A4Q7EMK5_9GAMM|nr:WYL domain-containing protein [Pseudoalteromonas rubra]RZM84948.1 transcriptional regulator [Pseudoalteromonas rubra]